MKFRIERERYEFVCGPSESETRKKMLEDLLFIDFHSFAMEKTCRILFLYYDSVSFTNKFKIKLNSPKWIRILFLLFSIRANPPVLRQRTHPGGEI